MRQHYCDIMNCEECRDDYQAHRDAVKLLNKPVGQHGKNVVLAKSAAESLREGYSVFVACGSLENAHELLRLIAKEMGRGYSGRGFVIDKKTLAFTLHPRYFANTNVPPTAPGGAQENRMTSKEKVLLQRRTFAAGYVRGKGHTACANAAASGGLHATGTCGDGKSVACDFANEANAEAARRYPLPTIIRPRVVREAARNPSIHSDRLWRVAPDGQLQTRGVNQENWQCVEADYPEPNTVNDRPYRFTAERIRLLHDLINNPTEQVEDDA